MRYRSHPLLIALACICFTQLATALEKQHHPLIDPIIDAFASNDISAISKHLRFPYKSTYPIPSISENDFSLRFDELFDPELIKVIAQSDISSDWSEVGWRGITLNRGIIWVDLEGKIIAINHTTLAAEQISDTLIAADKETLPKELRTFKHPILEWTTKQHRIRIDALSNESYRYVQWSRNAPNSTKPELVIAGGERYFDGSGGNHYYEFTQDNTKIKCYVINLGKDDTPGTITTYRHGVEIKHAIVLSSR